jgi:hypothetical protein
LKKITICDLEDEELEMSYTRDANGKWHKILENILAIS